MKPGSFSAVAASMEVDSAMSTPERATRAQEMCRPTHGSTQMQNTTVRAGGAGGRTLGRQKDAGGSSGMEGCAGPPGAPACKA